MSADLPPRRPNPFVGPRPFLPGEPLFGRDREIDVLRNLLVAERIVALYSPSGAGKTSLVQAGLIPRLREAEFHVLPVIRVNQPPLESNGAGVNRYVDSALRSLEQRLSPAEQRPAGSLRRLRLLDYLNERPRPHDAPDTDLLIFDQFEEMLTLDPTDAEAKTEFFTQVGEALRAEERWALFSFREDHLAGLDRFLPLLPTRLATGFRLEFLSPAAAVLAMRGTARSGGVEFAEDAAVQLAADLSQVRVPQPGGAVEERPGPSVEPVQLQVVCHRLWNLLPENEDEIDFALVQTHGDVSDALGAFYADSVAAVAARTGVPERDLRGWFDDNLITKHGIRGQILWVSGQGVGLGDAVIRALIDTHLVRAESRRGATWLELAHDRLIDPVRANNDAWYQANLSPLQQGAKLWIGQDRASGYLLFDEALQQAELWAAERRDELTGFEREFLAASVAHRRAQENERRLRDLEAAQRLAEEAQARRVAEEAARHEAEQRAVEQLAAAQSLAGEAQARQVAEEAARREAEHRATEQVVAARRLRRGLVAASVLGLLAVLAAIFAFRGFQLAGEERVEAERQTLIVQARSLAAAAPLQHESGQDERGALLARQASLFNQAGGGTATAAVDAALRAALGAPYFSRALPHVEGLATAVAFSPDGRFLAVGGGEPDQGDVRIWDMDDPTAAPQELPGFEGPHSPVAFSPDGRFLAAAGYDLESRSTLLRLWTMDTLEAEPAMLPADMSSVNSVAFAPDGLTLAAGGTHPIDEQGRVLVWDLGDPSFPARELTGFVAPVSSLAFSPDGTTLAVGVIDLAYSQGEVQLRNLDDPEAAPEILPGLHRPIFAVAFSPGGRRLAVGGANHVSVWDRSNPDADPVALLGAEGNAQAAGLRENGIAAVAFAPDGRTLAAGDLGGGVRLWNLDDALNDPTAGPTLLPGARGAIRAISFSPDGRFLAAGGDSVGEVQGMVRIWDVGAPVAAPITLGGGGSPIYSVAHGPDGRTLAGGSGDGQVGLWDLDDPAVVPDILGTSAGEVRSVAIDPAGTTLAAGSRVGTVQLWSLRDPSAAPITLDAAGDEVSAVAFSPDGQTLAAGGGASPSTAPPNGDTEAIAPEPHGTLLLWDRSDPRADPVVLRGHTDLIGAIAFSPDGTILASASNDRTVRLWSLTTPDARPVVLDAFPDQVWSVAISHDSRLLAAGGRDGAVRIWDLRDTEAAPVVLFGVQAGVGAVAFDPNGQTLATGSADGAVRLWNLADFTAAPILLPGNPFEVYAVSFSPDGRSLAAAGSGGTVNLWITNTEDLSALVCETVWRNLTLEEWTQFVGPSVPYEPTCPNPPPDDGAP